MNFQRKEKQEYGGLVTGMFKGIVRAINPTAEELAKLKGYTLKDDAKEPVYTGTDKNGDDYVVFSFHIQSDAPDSSLWVNRQIRITNKFAQTKKGEFTFVNQTGAFSIAADIADVKEYFLYFQDKNKNNVIDADGNPIKKVYRKALIGEVDLYNFLTKWLYGVNFWSPDNNVLIDTKRVFTNVNKFIKDEYQGALDEYAAFLKMSKEEQKVQPTPYASDLVGLATVYTTDEGKNYQNVYKDFLPGWLYGEVKAACLNSKWTHKGLTYFHKQLTGEYKPKDAFKLCLLESFDAETCQQTNGVAFTGPDEDDEATTSAAIDTAIDETY